jgi:hypothetical protein
MCQARRDQVRSEHFSGAVSSRANATNQRQRREENIVQILAQRRGVSRSAGSWRNGTRWRGMMVALLAISTLACGPQGRDVHDAFNSRDTGPYLSLGRVLSPDGALLVHVLADQPEHAEEIARHIVRQNLATSPSSVRIVVDASGGGARQAFRWDAHGLKADPSTEGLPPPRDRASRERPAPRH